MKQNLHRIIIRIILSSFLLTSNLGFSQCNLIQEIHLTSSPIFIQSINENSIHIEGQTYKWEPSIGLSCKDCISPSFSINKDTLIHYTLTTFDKNLKCLQVQHFSMKNIQENNDVIIVEKISDTNKTLDTIPNFVDEKAFFSGYNDFLVKNLKYPETAIENDLSGICYIDFIVSHTGIISNINVIQGVTGCPECDQEAIRIIQLIPKWTPAKLNGKNVSSYFNYTISFTLN